MAKGAKPNVKDKENSRGQEGTADADSAVETLAPGLASTQLHALKQVSDNTLPTKKKATSKATAPIAYVDNVDSTEGAASSKSISDTSSSTHFQSSPKTSHAHIPLDPVGDISKQQAKPKRRSKKVTIPLSLSKASSDAGTILELEKGTFATQLVSRPAVKRKSDTVPNLLLPAKKRSKKAATTHSSISGHAQIYGGPLNMFEDVQLAPTSKPAPQGKPSISVPRLPPDGDEEVTVTDSKNSTLQSHELPDDAADMTSPLSTEKKKKKKRKKTRGEGVLVTGSRKSTLPQDELSATAAKTTSPISTEKKKKNKKRKKRDEEIMSTDSKNSTLSPHKLPDTVVDIISPLLTEKNKKKKKKKKTRDEGVLVTGSQRSTPPPHKLLNTAADTTSSLSKEEKKKQKRKKKKRESKSSKVEELASSVHEPSKAKKKSMVHRPEEPLNTAVNTTSPLSTEEKKKRKKKKKKASKSSIVDETAPSMAEVQELSKAKTKVTVKPRAMSSKPERGAGRKSMVAHQSGPPSTKQTIASDGHRLRAAEPEISNRFTQGPSFDNETSPGAARGGNLQENMPDHWLQASNPVPIVQSSALSSPLGIDAEVIRSADEMFAQHPLSNIPPAAISISHQHTHAGLPDDRTRAVSQAIDLIRAPRYAASDASSQSTPLMTLQSQESIAPGLGVAGVNFESIAQRSMDQYLSLDEARRVATNFFLSEGSHDTQFSDFLEAQPLASSTNPPLSPGQTLQQTPALQNITPTSQPDLVVRSSVSQLASYPPVQLLPGASGTSQSHSQSSTTSQTMAPLADPHLEQRSQIVAATSQPGSLAQEEDSNLNPSTLPHSWGGQQAAPTIAVTAQSNPSMHHAPNHSSRPETNQTIPVGSMGQRQAFSFLGPNSNPQPDLRYPTQAQRAVTLTTNLMNAPEAARRNESLVLVPEVLAHQIKVPKVHPEIQLMRRSRLDPPLDPVYCLDVDWFLYSFAKMSQSSGDSNNQDEHVEKIQRILKKWQSILGVALFHPNSYSAYNGDDIGRIIAQRAISNQTDLALPGVINYFQRMQASALDEMKNASGEDYAGHPDDLGTGMSWYRCQMLEEAFFSRAKDGIEAICRQRPAQGDNETSAQLPNDSRIYPDLGTNRGSEMGGRTFGLSSGAEGRGIPLNFESPFKHPKPAGTLQMNNRDHYAITAPDSGPENEDGGVDFSEFMTDEFMDQLD